MWKNVGQEKILKIEGKRMKEDPNPMDSKKRRGYWRVDCQSASKGLFLGLLCLVGGIIILIIFFVMKVSNRHFFIKYKVGYPKGLLFHESRPC